jgi:hypothetical protein
MLPINNFNVNVEGVQRYKELISDISGNVLESPIIISMNEVIAAIKYRTEIRFTVLLLEKRNPNPNRSLSSSLKFCSICILE